MGRALLPFFGSAQSVWLTCLMFFQLTLFAGYLYAHLLSFTAKKRLIHGALLGLALVALPQLDAVSLERFAANDSPAVGVLLALVRSIGVPFFLLTTCAPLVQRVYAERSRVSPYPLYAASNFGSLAGLLAYPLIVEPMMGLSEQVVWWNRAFVVLVLGLGVVFLQRTTVSRPTRDQRVSAPTGLKMQWLLMAAIPSSLLMGTTTYLTTDIASIPLLWVVPLSLYLITFIVAFGRQRGDVAPVTVRASRFLALAMLTALVMGVNQPAAILLAISLALLLLASLVCHTRLVALQPPPAALTSFYLYIAAGGALGGVFNALIAPILFTDILEYPLVILLFVAATQSRAVERWSEELRPAVPVVVGILLLIPLTGLLPGDPQLADGVIRIAVGIVVVLAYRLQHRGFAFPLALVAFFAVGSLLFNPTRHHLVDKHRGFYGVLRVHDTPEGRRTLVHGRIVHGREDLAQRGKCQPDGYYCRRSPLAAVIAQAQTLAAPRSIALIGVGAGNSICYATKAEKWDLYELSPAVDTFAREYFTYLESNNAAQAQTVIGDGRLNLMKSGERYALIVVDGFSSDSIPIHLLTREAVSGYVDHLVPDGLIAFHISNQYFQLAEPIANVAASLGLHAYAKQVDLADDCLPSRWVYLSRSSKPLEGWTQLTGEGDEAWSDEKAHLLSALGW